MAERLQARADDTYSDEEKQSTDSITRFRFIVLGIDEGLINDACDIILRSTGENKKQERLCKLREARVSGRDVSVVKSNAYWLENLKMYVPFSNSVRSIKTEMEFCYSMVFPGPHAFLLVHGDVRKSGKEHYLLRALSEVFGEEALDYSMVLFLHEYPESDVGRNRCVRKCRKRFHILKNDEDNVLKLLHAASETITKQRKAFFFTKDHDLLDKAETYFKKEFDARYRERESRLRGEENLRAKVTEMEKQNSKNERELQDLREELDAQRARANRLSEELDAQKARDNQLNVSMKFFSSKESELIQQMDTLKMKRHELKEELHALRYLKRQKNVEQTTSNDTESQLKSDCEKCQRELEQLKGNEKKIEKSPRESNMPIGESPLTKLQLEHNRFQESKEVQAPTQEEHDRPGTSDRREVELERQRKLQQTVTGSLPAHHFSTAVASASVSEDKGKTRSQEDIGSLEFERLELARQNSKKFHPPDVSKNKVRPQSLRECEIYSQSSRSITGEEVKPVRRRSSIEHLPNMPEDKDKLQEATGYLEFEGSKLVRENSEKLHPPDESEHDLHF